MHTLHYNVINLQYERRFGIFLHVKHDNMTMALLDTKATTCCTLYSMHDGLFYYLYSKLGDWIVITRSYVYDTYCIWYWCCKCIDMYACLLIQYIAIEIINVSVIGNKVSMSNNVQYYTKIQDTFRVYIISINNNE